jgi:NTE family protein
LQFDDIALVLQGGGALGSYQAGVMEALAEKNINPTWIAGISIGALNTAIIAGNPPEKRVAQLKAFWDTICSAPPPAPANMFSLWSSYLNDSSRKRIFSS